MNPIIIGIIIIGIIAVTACITIRIWQQENTSESEWQVIRYSGSSVEPKDIYICKRCNNKSDINYHYCDNCGAIMTNGIPYCVHQDKIDLSDDE